eukprot:gene3737-6625_t
MIMTMEQKEEWFEFDFEMNLKVVKQNGSFTTSEAIIGLSKKEFSKLLENQDYLEYQNSFVGLKKSKISGEKEFDDCFIKKIIQSPLQEIPSIIQWYLASDQLEYFAFEKVFKNQDLTQFFVIPPIMSEYIKIGGDIELFEIDEFSCKQVMTTYIYADFWGGSMLSELISSSTSKCLDTVPSAVNQWLKMNK